MSWQLFHALEYMVRRFPKLRSKKLIAVGEMYLRAAKLVCGWKFRGGAGWTKIVLRTVKYTCIHLRDYYDLGICVEAVFRRFCPNCHRVDLREDQLLKLSYKHRCTEGCCGITLFHGYDRRIFFWRSSENSTAISVGHSHCIMCLCAIFDGNTRWIRIYFLHVQLQTNGTATHVKCGKSNKHCPQEADTSSLANYKKKKVP